MWTTALKKRTDGGQRADVPDGNWRGTFRQKLRRRLGPNGAAGNGSVGTTKPADEDRNRGFQFSNVLVSTPDRYLTTGMTISVSPVSLRFELAATVRKVMADETWLELVRPTSEHPFQSGDPLRVKFWDETAAFYFDSQALTIGSPSNRDLTIKRASEGVSVQRRKAYRVRETIPFSFTVVDAQQNELVGEKVCNAQTKDISVGGLAFRTPLPLKIKDKLEITLFLPTFKRVVAAAWVVRSEPIEYDGRLFYTAALEFLHYEAEDQNRLMLFLAQTHEAPTDDVFWTG